MGLRKEIRSLTAAELTKLREAFKKLKAASGANGYQNIAGFHGCPSFLCPHHDLKFLPWHRIYILQIEKQLQAFDKTVNLPYWDWASAESIASGIPTAYTDKTNNSLLNSTIAAAQQCGIASPTTRNPKAPALLDQYKDQVALAMKKKSFEDFSSAIEAPHDNLHVWVRGSMGAVISAAFDPIFWAHHCNIDRYWALWQDAGGANPRAPFPRTVLNPFGVTVARTLDYRALGYTYPKPKLQKLSPLNDSMSLELPQSRTVLKVRIGGMAEQSMELRFFANDPKANAKTKTVGNPNFLGEVGIFGLGGPMSLHDHTAHMSQEEAMEAQDAASVSEAPPKEHVLDITNIAQQESTEKMKIKVVAVDLDGNEIDLKNAPVAGVTIDHDVL